MQYQPGYKADNDNFIFEKSVCSDTGVYFDAGHVKWKHALLMCVGVVLPWMGIDILQFDEFFLLPVYAVIGITYSTRRLENKKLESSKGEI